MAKIVSIVLLVLVLSSALAFPERKKRALGLSGLSGGKGGAKAGAAAGAGAIGDSSSSSSSSSESGGCDKYIFLYNIF
ncbi:unnamed protein product [Euphydryas editha]|uniref:Uncharacterized protein n=1 Tax=Euphydryas editha TaxID=104508 RepID=A0AAU9UUT7_EUPED|nr:unnamed protein product [Euphydryas editha]